MRTLAHLPRVSVLHRFGAMWVNHSANYSSTRLMRYQLFQNNGRTPQIPALERSSQSRIHEPPLR
jgi:hypothetical protein